MSKAIRSLEQELGISLFERSSKGVRPTQAGVLFEKYARRMCAQREQLLAKLAEQEKRETIVIGMTTGAAMLCLPDLEQRLYQVFPDASFVIREGFDYDCDAGTESGEFLFSVSAEPMDGQKFYSIPLKRYRVHGIVGENHPLAEKDSLSLQDLDGEKMIIYSRRYKAHEEFMKRCRKVEVVPQIAMETVNALSIYKKCGSDRVIGLGVETKEHVLDRYRCRAIPFEEEFNWVPCLIRKKGKSLTGQEKKIWDQIVRWFRE